LADQNDITTPFYGEITNYLAVIEFCSILIKNLGGNIMAVKEKIQGDVAVLQVSGKLMGGDETKEVHEMVKSLLADGLKKVVIDVSKVKWLNSSGLGMLISCLTSVTSAEGKLKIAGATEKINSLFMITKLITVFDSYETVDRAMATFK
jgi:anti-sigma B factor antagonist